ncbi:MAG: YcgN family cysteine cluster protein [Deltaproteobacteria bacterium]|nr:YcgN family cysteine cluster protein [Deltaproteobacteria bacterium]
MRSEAPFWKSKKLVEMTPQEWESLCDGCSRCCLQKLEYEESGELAYTRVVCRYLEEHSCQCRHYHERTRLVPTCLRLNPDNLAQIHFLPDTCAYRLLAEGRELAWWHPLVSGNDETVFTAGIAVRGKVLSEDYVHPDGWEEHIIDWVS